MGRFDASLKTMGDLHGLPAVVFLENNRLSIAAGNEPIGDWDLSEIRLERAGNGYRMAAEGEHLMLEFPNPDEFAHELASSSKPFRVGRSRTKRSRSAHTRAAPSRTAPSRAAPSRTAPSRTAMPDKESFLKAKESFLQAVDKTIEVAEERLGDLLPGWMFTRVMAGFVGGTLLLMLILPGLVSLFLIIAGVSTIMLGAISYTDTMLANRWLPGRMTPVHVLLFGVVILLLGIVLGVIAG